MTEQQAPAAGAQPAAATPAPAPPAQPRAAGFRGRVDVASLFPAGHPVPPRGTAEYANAVMTAGRVEFGKITAAEATAELTGQLGAQEQGSAPASEHSAAAGEQTAPATPVDAMNASRELAAGLQEAGEIAGLDPHTAEHYAGVLREGLQNPPTESAKHAAKETTLQQLQHAYGNKAERMIADARAELNILAQRLPKLPQWFEVTGAGNDAGIIIRLAQSHADRQRARLVKQVRGGR